jgi:D-alanine-D-alanine ligase
VTKDDELKERVEFIHTRLEQAALVEQYVDGRELYVSILGNHRLQVFPLRELTFGELPPDEPRIATYTVKWDEEYRKRWKIRYQAARNLPNGAEEKIRRLCKRAYRLLQLRGYARFDIRLREDGQIYILEANPNPFLAKDEDFAESAAKAELSYDTLIDRIVQLAMS